MDFIMGLPWTINGYVTIWVVVDKFTKFAHFLPLKVTCSIEHLAEL